MGHVGRLYSSHGTAVGGYMYFRVRVAYEVYVKANTEQDALDIASDMRLPDSYVTDSFEANISGFETVIRS